MTEPPRKVVLLRIFLEHLPSEFERVNRTNVIEDLGGCASISDELIAQREHLHMYAAARFLTKLVGLFFDQDPGEVRPSIKVNTQHTGQLGPCQFKLWSRGLLPLSSGCACSSLFSLDIAQVCRQFHGDLGELYISCLGEALIVWEDRAQIDPVSVFFRHDVLDFAHEVIFAELVDQVAINIAREDGQ